VIYSVPDAEVTCEWVVLLDQDGANGDILEQNDDATHYFMQKLTAIEAKPLVLKRTTPVYPAIAQAALVQGEVKLQVIVGLDGKPASVTVLSGNGMLSGAAKDAVRGWTFKPFQIGTRTVSFQTEVTFHYTFTGMNFGSISSTP
jgi:TonB family protein